MHVLTILKTSKRSYLCRESETVFVLVVLAFRGPPLVAVDVVFECANRDRAGRH